MNKSDRWLIVAEIDARYWVLKQMLGQEESRSAIARMVDEATDFDKEKLREAKRLMRRIQFLKKKLAVIDSEVPA